MEEMLDRAPGGFVSFTDAGIIVDINATLVDILGYAPGELNHQKFESILTLSSRIFFQTHFFPLLTLQGKAEEIFITLRAKDHKSVPVLVNAVRRKQAESYLSTCVLIMVSERQKYEDEILQAKRVAEDALRNNTELVQAKQALEEYTQELDRKISQLEQKNREHLRVSQILFHDLWEPLRKIFTFTDLLAQEFGDTLSSPRRSLLNRIRTASTRIGDLLRSLQAFVSVDAIDEDLAQVELNEVVKSAKNAVSKEGYQCEIISTTLPVIEGYPRQLVALFSQLIDNAIKFRKPGTLATIHICHSLIQQNRYQRSKGRYLYVDFVKILFEDNGLGFDAAYMTSIFELFKKLEPNSPGTGAGLAICKKVVENHFGSITAKSDAGKGVTFTISLPLQQRLTSAASAQAAHALYPPPDLVDEAHR